MKPSREQPLEPVADHRAGLHTLYPRQFIAIENYFALEMFDQSDWFEEFEILSNYAAKRRVLARKVCEWQLAEDQSSQT